MHGLSGPERYTVVTAYDQGAAALYGWSGGGRSSSILFEPEKLEKYRDWFLHVDSVVVVGQRQEHRDERAIYLRALQRGVELLQRREDGGYHAGQRSTRSGPNPLIAITRLAPAVRRICRAFSTRSFGIWQNAAIRQSGSWSFRSRPARGENRTPAAAGDFRAIHDLMWKINELAGEKYEKVAEPAIRLQIAKLIHEAQQHDASACRQIEAAIAKVVATAR